MARVSAGRQAMIRKRLCGDLSKKELDFVLERTAPFVHADHTPREIAVRAYLCGVKDAGETFKKPAQPQSRGSNDRG